MGSDFKTIVTHFLRTVCIMYIFVNKNIVGVRFYQEGEKKNED